MSIINTNLLLRLLNVQEFFAHQWLTSCPNDNQMLADLINIRKRQFSLKNIIINQEKGDNTGTASGGRGTTIKGLRAKNDPNVNPNIKNKRLSR